MRSTLPDYIVQRVRRPAPPNSRVVPGSTPVLSFGDARSARVATLGLNPSRREFVDGKGVELSGSSRRLCTLQSLGVTDLAQAPSDDVIRQVVEDCSSYFGRQPYRAWFDKLETIVQSVGTSYYAGSACHLDLIQWATNPTWRGLRPGAREQLLQDDGLFLLQQLRNEHIGLMLVNGRATVRCLTAFANLELEPQPPLAGFCFQPTSLYVGVLDGVRVIAWSTNLQSSFGVKREFGERLAERVAQLAR